MTRRLLTLLLAAFCSTAALSQELQGELVGPPRGCEPGYEKGVSGQFYISNGGILIVAGGANFPDTPAAEGGKKRFYKGIFWFDNDEWREIGELPEPAAHGWTAFNKHTNIMYFAGGANENGSMQTVNRIIYTQHFGNKSYYDTIRCSALTQMPEAVEQCAATGDYLIGGVADGVPSDKIYKFEKHQWKLLETRLPTNLVQPVAIADSNYIYVWGGFTPPATVPVGGWRLDLKTHKWQKITTPPTQNLTGATLTPWNGGFLVIGGVNIEIFERALVRRELMKTAQSTKLEQLKEEDRRYMTMSPSDYKFNDKLLFYNPKTDVWTSLGTSQNLARAGAAALIDHNQRLIVTGGELKPGIRNPQTWILDLKTLPSAIID